MSAASSKAVVLLSGGLDSYTAAAIAREAGFDLYALTVKYGQRHAHEILASRKVAEALGVKAHRELAVDLASLGGSALLGDGEVPKDGPHPDTIPATYVPARNTVMLSLALAWAEVLGAYDIFIGVNALDYSGYPDCRPEFIEAFENTAEAGNEGGRRGQAVSHPGAADFDDEGADHPARPCRSASITVSRTAATIRCRTARRAAAATAACCARAASRKRGRKIRSGGPMSSERLYYTDAYLVEFDAVVRDVRPAGRPLEGHARSHRVLSDVRRPAVRHGTLGDAKVIDVVRSGRRHDRPPRRSRAREELRACAATSTGTAVSTTCSSTPASICCRRPSSARWALRTVSFHLGTSASTIDLDKELSADQIARVEDAANRVLWEDREVCVKFVTAAEAAKLPLRKDPAREGELRIIEIKDYDLSACGGTHVQSDGRDRHDRASPGSNASRADCASSSSAAVARCPSVPRA